MQVGKESVESQRRTDNGRQRKGEDIVDFEVKDLEVFI